MDPSKHDYLIVEAEADRVAKEAVKALKRSRSQCLGPMAGVPNWTGQHGSMTKKYVRFFLLTNLFTGFWLNWPTLNIELYEKCEGMLDEA